MYYVVIMKADSQTVNNFETKNEAYEGFHSEMAYAFNQNIETTCLVVDKYGSQLKRDRCEGETVTGDEN